MTSSRKAWVGISLEKSLALFSEMVLSSKLRQSNCLKAIIIVLIIWKWFICLQSFRIGMLASVANNWLWAYWWLDLMDTMPVTQHHWCYTLHSVRHIANQIHSCFGSLWQVDILSAFHLQMLLSRHSGAWPVDTFWWLDHSFNLSPNFMIEVLSLLIWAPVSFDFDTALEHSGDPFNDLSLPVETQRETQLWGEEFLSRTKNGFSDLRKAYHRSLLD